MPGEGAFHPTWVNFKPLRGAPVVARPASASNTDVRSRRVRQRPSTAAGLHRKSNVEGPYEGQDHSGLETSTPLSLAVEEPTRFMQITPKRDDCLFTSSLNSPEQGTVQRMEQLEPVPNASEAPATNAQVIDFTTYSLKKSKKEEREKDREGMPGLHDFGAHIPETAKEESPVFAVPVEEKKPKKRPQLSPDRFTSRSPSITSPNSEKYTVPGSPTSPPINGCQEGKEINEIKDNKDNKEVIEPIELTRADKKAIVKENIGGVFATEAFDANAEVCYLCYSSVR